MSRIEITDPGKLLVLVLLLVAATVLVIVGKLDSDAWMVIVASITSYSYGNGRLASRGKAPGGLFGTKGDQR